MVSWLEVFLMILFVARSARDDESTVKRAPNGKWLTSGNPAGRPVGSRNKFADNFFADLTAA
jgi:hypothetical protein